jgi:hypothetical protein
VPGICPSCTQLEFHPSPVPEELPDRETEAGDGVGNEAGDGYGDGDGRDGVKIKVEENEEGKAGLAEGIGSGSGSGGKDYFFKMHIRQLEEKLNAARLREAENNVEISALRAQVGLLIEGSKSGEQGYQTEVTRSSVTEGPMRIEEAREQGYNVVERNGVQTWGLLEQGNGALSASAEQVNAKLREVTPDRNVTAKEKFAHIAAISFTAPIISKVLKLKSVIHPSDLEQWFDKQIKYTFECAGEGDFGKMIRGYRDFVDFIGVELNGVKYLEVEAKKVLGECEEFVQVVIDVEEAL